jgi:hypothetical protein
VLQPSPTSPKLGIARCRIDVTTAGPVGLKLDATEGVSIWIAGIAVDPGQMSNLELKSGVRVVTFAVEMDRMTGPLRCELLDVPESPARAQFVGGK